MDDARFTHLAYYQRLVLQIKQQVTAGILAPGEKLPSVREMAKRSQLNPNTVAKAYKQLEADRVVEVRPGLGSFIAAAQKAPQQAEVSALHQRFAALMVAIQAAGVDQATVQQWVEEEMGHES
ncbi:GntR family transcriptional regulator [Lacticaseibacillus parakribbianus]|uniref:GntR family transcriptional regulator n=1 Tax=Lacticaseibacillus parakribbianus TaxID=2970927 RepID=UPI0021CB1789|nr:GntR family transcriptional regulator [Lacticaseibacillus parakribbianus]